MKCFSVPTVTKSYPPPYVVLFDHDQVPWHVCSPATSSSGLCHPCHRGHCSYLGRLGDDGLGLMQVWKGQQKSYTTKEQCT